MNRANNILLAIRKGILIKPPKYTFIAALEPKDKQVIICDNIKPHDVPLASLVL
jgi:hypothetical protein